jgi:hypothetical protein
MLGVAVSAFMFKCCNCTIASVAIEPLPELSSIFYEFASALMIFIDIFFSCLFFIFNVRAFMMDTVQNAQKIEIKYSEG